MRNIHMLLESIYQWFVEVPPNADVNQRIVEWLGNFVDVNENVLSGVEDTDGRPHNVYRFPNVLLSRLLEMEMNEQNKTLKIRIFNRRGFEGPIRECSFLLKHKKKEVVELTAAASK